MKIYQWNIGNSFWLVLANRAGDARMVLIDHAARASEHQRITPAEHAQIVEALLGSPDFVASQEYPIVLSVPVPVARG